jgi:hypothetical protein
MTSTQSNWVWGIGLFYTINAIGAMILNKDYVTGIICLVIAWFCIYGLKANMDVIMTKLFRILQLICAISTSVTVICLLY